MSLHIKDNYVNRDISFREIDSHNEVDIRITEFTGSFIEVAINERKALQIVQHLITQYPGIWKQLII